VLAELDFGYAKQSDFHKGPILGVIRGWSLEESTRFGNRFPRLELPTSTSGSRFRATAAGIYAKYPCSLRSPFEYPSNTLRNSFVAIPEQQVRGRRGVQAWDRVQPGGIRPTFGLDQEAGMVLPHRRSFRSPYRLELAVEPVEGVILHGCVEFMRRIVEAGDQPVGGLL
jgi:hypothetical protein